MKFIAGKLNGVFRYNLTGLIFSKPGTAFYNNNGLALNICLGFLHIYMQSQQDCFCKYGAFGNTEIILTLHPWTHRLLEYFIHFFCTVWIGDSIFTYLRFYNKTIYYQ